MSKVSKTQKGEQTKKHILEVALRLFDERGFDKTSMRLIAKEAEVSVGNAYYYFASKEHLVQGFYNKIHLDHKALVVPALAGERNLRNRIKIMLDTKIETAAPYHEFSGVLFRTAADPKSPLNPFSPETKTVRDEATDVMSLVLEGARQKVPKGLEEDLPRLLWLYQMSIILFWIHDDSPKFERSYKLIDQTSDIVAKIIRLLGNPLLTPIRRATVRLLADLRFKIA